MNNLFSAKVKSIAKVTLTTVLLSSPFLAVQASNNWDIAKPSKDRLEVRSLLEQAHVFWNDPGKISDAGYTGKLPSKLEAISLNLTKASKLAPERMDIQLALANNLILQKKTEEAYNLFSSVAKSANNNPKALTFKAIWGHYLNKKAEYTATLKMLKKVHPAKYTEITRDIKIIQEGKNSPLVDKAFKIKGNKTAIVTLGYALDDNGKMNPILIKRLEKTLEAAKLNPKSFIVVTGGVPKNNVTEAILMKAWLIKHGIKEALIVVETYARSTVENALYSTDILATRGIDATMIISSASHVRRAITLFKLAALQDGLKMNFTTLAYPDKPLASIKDASKKEMMGIYRDTLRVTHYGLYNAYPFLEQ